MALPNNNLFLLSITLKKTDKIDKLYTITKTRFNLVKNQYDAIKKQINENDIKKDVKMEQEFLFKECSEVFKKASH